MEAQSLGLELRHVAGRLPIGLFHRKRNLAWCYMSEQEPQGDKQVCILREVDGEDGYRFFVWSFGSGAERSSTASNPPKPEEETPVQAQAKDPVSTALTPNGPFFGRAEMELAHGELMMQNTRSTHSAPIRSEPDQWMRGSTAGNPFFAGSDFSQLITDQDSLMRGRSGADVSSESIRGV